MLTGCPAKFEVASAKQGVPIAGSKNPEHVEYVLKKIRSNQRIMNCFNFMRRQMAWQ